MEIEGAGATRPFITGSAASPVNAALSAMRELVPGVHSSN